LGKLTVSRNSRPYDRWLVLNTLSPSEKDQVIYRIFGDGTATLVGRFAKIDELQRNINVRVLRSEEQGE